MLGNFAANLTFGWLSTPSAGRTATLAIQLLPQKLCAYPQHLEVIPVIREQVLLHLTLFSERVAAKVAEEKILGRLRMDVLPHIRIFGTTWPGSVMPL